MLRVQIWSAHQSDVVGVLHMHKPFINILPFVSKVDDDGFCLGENLIHNPIGNDLVGQTH
jgi:hypothetical protein